MGTVTNDVIQRHEGRERVNVVSATQSPPRTSLNWSISRESDLACKCQTGDAMADCKGSDLPEESQQPEIGNTQLEEPLNVCLFLFFFRFVLYFICMKSREELSIPISVCSIFVCPNNGMAACV